MRCLPHLIARGRIALALVLALGLGLTIGSSVALAFPAQPSMQTTLSDQTKSLSQVDGQGGFVLVVGAATCEIVPPLPPTLNEAGCVAAVGVALSVVADSGEDLGGCTTNVVVPSGQLAQCEVVVPYEISGQVFQDNGTIPAGYLPQANPINFTSPPPGPVDGIVSRPIFVNLPAGGPDVDVPPVEPGEPVEPSQAEQPDTTPAEADRLATVTTGTCAEPGDPAAASTAINAPQGDSIGLPTALIAETGGGVITLPLDDLFASPHAIVVVTPGTASNEAATTVACGDLGTVADDDGVAVIGLASMGDSGLAGIAYLTTDSGNPAQTLVSIFLVDGLSEG